MRREERKRTSVVKVGGGGIREVKRLSFRVRNLK